MPRLALHRPRYDPRKHGAKCNECPFFKEDPFHPVPPRVSMRPKMVVICESPGDVEVWKSEPLVGPTGECVRAAFVDLKIPLNRVTLTNAICCLPDREKSHEDMAKATECCRPRLLAELRNLRKDVVLHACGKYSLLSTIGSHNVGTHAGLVSQGVKELERFTVVGNWHPTYAFMRVRYLRPIYLRYLKRAWDFASRKITCWKWPDFTVGVDDLVLERLHKINNQKGPVAFDVENIPSMDVLTCLGVSDGRHTVTVPWHSYDTAKYGSILGLEHYGNTGTEIKRLIKEILETHCVVAHNAVHDLTLAMSLGIEIRDYFDTMLAHAVIYQPYYHGLEHVAVQYLHCPRWKREFKVDSDAKGLDAYVQRPYEELSIYNSRDTYITRLLFDVLKNELDEYHNGWSLYESYKREAEVAHKAGERGIKVSRKVLEKYGKMFTNRFEAHKQRLKEIAEKHNMHDINPNSDDQIRKLLFEKLKAPSMHKTKTGKESLNKKGRASILAVTQDLRVVEVINELSELKKWGKLKSSYVDKIAKNLDEDDLYHPSFAVYAAVSGRWGSFIHTLPKPVYKGKEVVIPAMRDAFLAREGHWFVEADFSQLEVRIIAMFARDLKLIEAYQNNADIHTQNCIDLFGEYTKQNRTFAKNFIYNVNYGPTNLRILSQSVWENLRKTFPNISLLRVNQLVKQWFRVHHWIAKWREEQIVNAKKNDYTREPFSGRTRWLYGEIKDTDLYNYWIQTCGAYLVSRALTLVIPQLDWVKHNLVTQWHDALIIESTDPIEAAQILGDALTTELDYDGYKMPYTCDYKVGKTLGDLKGCDTIDEIKKLVNGVDKKVAQT